MVPGGHEQLFDKTYLIKIGVSSQLFVVYVVCILLSSLESKMNCVN